MSIFDKPIYVNVKDRSDDIKKQVQQAFFDNGIKWRGHDTSYKNLHAWYYTNVYANSHERSLRYGATESNLETSISPEEFFKLVNFKPKLQVGIDTSKFIIISLWKCSNEERKNVVNLIVHIAKSKKMHINAKTLCKLESNALSKNFIGFNYEDMGYGLQHFYADYLEPALISNNYTICDYKSFLELFNSLADTNVRTEDKVKNTQSQDQNKSTQQFNDLDGLDGKYINLKGLASKSINSVNDLLLELGYTITDIVIDEDVCDSYYIKDNTVSRSTRNYENLYDVSYLIMYSAYKLNKQISLFNENIAKVIGITYINNSPHFVGYIGKKEQYMVWNSNGRTLHGIDPKFSLKALVVLKFNHWDILNKSINYIAKDALGNWLGFQDKPKLSLNSWNSDIAPFPLTILNDSDIEFPECHWEDSLISRK